MSDLARRHAALALTYLGANMLLAEELAERLAEEEPSQEAATARAQAMLADALQEARGTIAFMAGMPFDAVVDAFTASARITETGQETMQALHELLSGSAATGSAH